MCFKNISFGYKQVLVSEKIIIIVFVDVKACLRALKVSVRFASREQSYLAYRKHQLYPLYKWITKHNIEY